jgi:hypothetical protein
MALMEPSVGTVRGVALYQEYREMTLKHPLFSRRAFLGATLASAVLPKLAFGQAGQEETSMRIRIEFKGQSMTATLYDNPSARDFASMLPLDLTIDDFSTNEKIAYLPRKLTEEGNAPFGNEAPGDLCYYIPWGNLAFFYDSYRSSRDLIRLGRIDGSFEPLLTRGKFNLRIERLP